MAKLYPAITNKELTSVFRITATLNDPVKYPAIKEAVEITSKRFPYFSVSMGSGVFWHFLEFKNKPPRIQTEEKIPCTAFALKLKDEILYRILAKSNRISVEFIHIITDGAGAFEYLKSLLFTYFKLTGKDPESSVGIIEPDSQIADEEFEDGYNRFFKKLPSPKKMTMAWHLPFRLNKKPRLKVLTAEISVDQILNQARNNKVTLTEYFVSVYLFALQKLCLSEKERGVKQKMNVIRTEVPVNLRKIFPSRTLRNFSLFVMPELDLRLGIYSFEEILKVVKNQLQSGADIKQISRFLSSNVGYEKLLFVRVLPLFIKRMVITAVYRGLGSKRCSGIITNLGSFNIPEWMEKMTYSFDVIPPPPNTRVKVSCAMVSFKNKLRINFCNIHNIKA